MPAVLSSWGPALVAAHPSLPSPFPYRPSAHDGRVSLLTSYDARNGRSKRSSTGHVPYEQPGDMAKGVAALFWCDQLTEDVVGSFAAARDPVPDDGSGRREPWSAMRSVAGQVAGQSVTVPARR